MVLRVSLACIHVSGIEKKWSWWLERDGKKKKKEKKDGFRQPEFLFFEKKTQSAVLFWIGNAKEK